MQIRLVKSTEEIRACYPVMRELRPNYSEELFVEQVERQLRSGYWLAVLEDAGQPVCVAGFRLGECLAWGHYLYVDDLVSLPETRSLGHGRAMLEWLRERARSEGCEALHLNCGLQREAAHRFYEREGLTRASYHFKVSTP